jgi:uncharacterized protein (TIGR02145 family)
MASIFSSATHSQAFMVAASIMFAIMSIFSCADDLETIEWTGGPHLSGICEWEGDGIISSFEGIMALVSEGSTVTASGVSIENCEEGQGTILDSAFVVPEWNATSMLVTKQVHATCDKTLLSIDCPSIKIKNPANSAGISAFIDFRDGQIYQTVSIDSITWMAENLNYGGNNGNLGKCPDNRPDFCNVYGRLYSLDEAKVACPDGWRLPRDDEWDELFNDDFKRFIANSGWPSNLCDNDKCNETAFTALPQGIGESKAYWYSSSNMVYGLALKENIIRDYTDATGLYSVRCVK